MTTAAELLLVRAEQDAPALLFGDQAWSYRQLVEEGRRRVALFDELHESGRPPHIGVLLDNVPDYVFWLVRSGALRVRDRRHQLDVPRCTSSLSSSSTRTANCWSPRADSNLCSTGAGNPIPNDRVLVVDRPAYARRIEAASPADVDRAIAEDDLFLLIFTSGSTGLPKAVRCTQGRIARTGAHVATIAELTAADVVYSPAAVLPLQLAVHRLVVGDHRGDPDLDPARGSRRRTRWRTSGSSAPPSSPTQARCSTTSSPFPKAPDDADAPLRLAIGNEASERDIKEFARRFGCKVRDSYGSTEGVIIIRRDPSMPAGALGIADDSVRVINPETGRECPPGDLRARRARSLNLEQAVGEIVETEPSTGFEGYYRNEEATQAPGSATAGTGQATSRTATRTAGSTSPGARTSGSASTARTSLPVRSRRSSAATPTYAR